MIVENIHRNTKIERLILAAKSSEEADGAFASKGRLKWKDEECDHGETRVLDLSQLQGIQLRWVSRKSQRVKIPTRVNTFLRIQLSVTLELDVTNH